MRKMSKAAKAEVYDSLVRERDVWAAYAIMLTRDVRPDAIEVIDRVNLPQTLDEGEVYEYRLYGCERAHGGIVALLFHYPDQPVTVEVSYFDDWLKLTTAISYGIGGLSAERKIAADRLSRIRNMICRVGVEHR